VTKHEHFGVAVSTAAASMKSIWTSIHIMTDSFGVLLARSADSKKSHLAS
jgi:hypothetical protein